MSKMKLKKSNKWYNYKGTEIRCLYCGNWGDYNGPFKKTDKIKCGFCSKHFLLTKEEK